MKYQKLSRVGDGSFGIVYKAKSTGKVIPRRLSDKAKEVIKHIEDFGNGISIDEIEDLEEENLSDFTKVFEEVKEESSLPEIVAIKKTRL